MNTIFECNPNDLDVNEDLCVVMWITTTTWKPEGHWDSGYAVAKGHCVIHCEWEEQIFCFFFNIEIDGVPVSEQTDNVEYTTIESCIQAAIDFARHDLEQRRSDTEVRDLIGVDSWQEYERDWNSGIETLEHLVENWKQYYSEQVWEDVSE
jgi:hypothetical protein